MPWIRARDKLGMWEPAGRMDLDAVIDAQSLHRKGLRGLDGRSPQAKLNALNTYNSRWQYYFDENENPSERFQSTFEWSER